MRSSGNKSAVTIGTLGDDEPDFSKRNPWRSRIIKQIVNCPKENERKRDRFDVSLVTSILTPALSFSLVVFLHHLLLQCGDVESNPGPGNTGYKRMVSCAEKIVEGLSRDPRGLATSLSARGLISDTIMMETLIPKVDKARRLFTTVLEAVKLHPGRYDDFLAILREHGEVYTDLLEMLEIKERSEATTESESVPSEEEVEAKRQHLNACMSTISMADASAIPDYSTSENEPEPCDEKNFLNAIADLKVEKVRDLALQLGVDTPYLNDIQSTDKEERKMKLTQVLFSQKRPTWETIIDALESECMNENHIVRKIKRFYFLKSTSIDIDRPKSPLTPVSLQPFQDKDFPECEEKDVLNAVTRLADKKVSSLAVQLGIDKPQLDGISSCSTETRKSKLAELWFRHAKDKPPTWASLLNALKAPSMQEDWLADYIRKKYVEREREVISMNTDNEDSFQFQFSQQQLDLERPILELQDTAADERTPMEMAGSAPVVDVSELKDKLQAHANEQNRAQIKESFENLLDKIANELKSYNIRSSEVKDHVQKFIDSRPTFLRTKNRRQIQINNLFNEISRNKLWSFDNCGLVQHVTGIKGAVQSKVRMRTWLQKYKKEYNAYCVSEKLAVIIPYHFEEGFDNDLDRYPTHLKQELKLHVKYMVIDDDSLKYIDDLWEVIVESFKIPSMTALLKSIVHNCLIITWLIEPSWACCILSEIFGSISFFTKHLITKVLLGDVCIYDEHSGIIADNKVLGTLWLRQASLSGRIQKFKEVLAQPMIDINTVLSSDGATPLTIASMCGHVELVEFLLSNGADSSVKLANGQTVLHLAALEDYPDVVELLHTHNCELAGERDQNDYSALMEAAAHDHVDVIHVLVSQQDDLGDIEIPTLNEAFHLALMKGHTDSVNRLLRSKFKKEIIDSEDSDGMTPLVLAVLKQSPKLVDMLMTAGADPNLANRDGMTPLMLAAEVGQVDSVKLLVEKGAEVTLPHEMSGKTALHFASENGHTDVVELLALPEHQALAIKDMNVKTALVLTKNSEVAAVLREPLLKQSWKTVKQPFQSLRKFITRDLKLITACRRGDIKGVKRCLQKKANVDALDILRWTGLMRAAHNGHDEVVKLMLEHGANPDSKDIGGWTALILASRKGYFKVVRHLVDHGADVSLSNWQGWTALMWAAQSIGKQNKTKEALLNRIETAKIILEKDAASVVDKRANDQWTPLMQACQDGNTGLVELLVEKGANTELFNPKNWTPLMIATTKDRTDVVKALVERGAKGEHRNDKEGHGMSALHVACVKGRDECLRIMVEPAPGAKCQVDLEIKDKWGMTPLMMATKNGNEKCIEILVENGADVNTKSKQYAGWSPLFFAIKEGHLKIAKLLLANKASMTTKDQYEQTPLGFAFSHKKDIYQSLISFLQGKPQELKAIRATGEATTIKTSTPHTQATSLSPTLDTPTQLVQGEGTEAAPPTTAAQTEVPGATETDTTPAQLDQLIQQAKSSARSAVSTNMKDIERKHRNYMTQAMQSGRTAASAA